MLSLLAFVCFLIAVITSHVGDWLQPPLAWIGSGLCLMVLGGAMSFVSTKARNFEG